MPTITYEEQQLMALYNSAGTRTGLIAALREMREYLGPEEAISQILAGEGIPVLAHPFYGSGDQLVIGQEMEERLKRLTGFGLQGVEAFYSGFAPKLINQMLEMADRYHLYVTAGSDYHGKNKIVRLGDTGMEENAAPVPGMVRFLDAVNYTKK